MSDIIGQAERCVAEAGIYPDFIRELIAHAKSLADQVDALKAALDGQVRVAAEQRQRIADLERERHDTAVLVAKVSHEAFTELADNKRLRNENERLAAQVKELERERDEARATVACIILDYSHKDCDMLSKTNVQLREDALAYRKRVRAEAFEEAAIEARAVVHDQHPWSPDEAQRIGDRIRALAEKERP